jgi:hypothetical protein
MFMEMSHQRQQTSDNLTSSQRASNELVKLIRKLRWMGMEDEADLLVKELEGRVAAADSTVAMPRETD